MKKAILFIVVVCLGLASFSYDVRPKPRRLSHMNLPLSSGLEGMIYGAPFSIATTRSNGGFSRYNKVSFAWDNAIGSFSWTFMLPFDYKRNLKVTIVYRIPGQTKSNKIRFGVVVSDVTPGMDRFDFVHEEGASNWKTIVLADDPIGGLIRSETFVLPNKASVLPGDWVFLTLVRDAVGRKDNTKQPMELLSASISWSKIK